MRGTETSAQFMAWFRIRGSLTCAIDGRKMASSGYDLVWGQRQEAMLFIWCWNSYLHVLALYSEQNYRHDVSYGFGISAYTILRRCFHFPSHTRHKKGWPLLTSRVYLLGLKMMSVPTVGEHFTPALFLRPSELGSGLRPMFFSFIEL